MNMPSQQTHHEINDYRPTVLEQFVGQEGVVARIKVALEASWNDGTRLPDMLFVGGSGLGKTQLAEVITKEMGCELKQQLAQNLNLPSALHGFLVDSEDRGVLFIDEVHELGPQAQTLLYRSIEEKYLFLPQTPYRDKPQTIPLPHFTLIAATTDQFVLLAPLLNRFKIVAHFRKYSADELLVMLEQRCHKLQWIIEPDVLVQISQRGRGVPRRALRLLEAVHRTARSQGETGITSAHLDQTCRLETIDPAGLDELEQRYLDLLHASGGQTRLNVVAAHLGLPTQTIQRIVEPPLLEEGYIEKQQDGQRILTTKALNHLEHRA